MQTQEQQMVREFANDLHEAISEAEGGDFDATCTLANHVLSLFFPHAERHQGEYDGEDHEWARLEGEFFDVTASQFGGPAIVCGELPEEYEGEEVEWDITRWCGDAERVVEILEERGWEQW